MIDITAHRQTLEALSLADQRKDDFLATIAHELRNPLTAIGAATRLLSTVQLDTAATEKCIDMIRRQSKLLSRLADDLLDLSHIVHDRLTLKIEPIDVCHVIKTAIEALQQPLEVRGHELHITLPPARLMLDGDAARLTQVFMNLLTNAIKYTPNAGSIVIGVGREGARANVYIRDSGIGIMPEHLPHVFEPFYQASNALARAGRTWHRSGACALHRAAAWRFDRPAERRPYPHSCLGGAAAGIAGGADGLEQPESPVS